MSTIDWTILICTISFIVFYGIYKTRKFNTIKDHLKGGGSANWLTSRPVGDGYSSKCHNIPIDARTSL